MGKPGVFEKKNLIKLALERIKDVPMQAQSGQTNYKNNIISVLNQIDHSNYLESEKEQTLIALFEIIVEATQKEIDEHRIELKELLNFLKETKKNNAQVTLPREPAKSARKTEGSRKKGLNIQFDLDKNTEASFTLEKGRALNASTKGFKQAEQEKRRIKRIPNERGEVQLKSFGKNPPLKPQAKPYEGHWMPESNIKELQEYFASNQRIEAANISLNQDGTYLVEMYTEGENAPDRSNYNIDEMHEMLFGSRFQNHLRKTLDDDQTVVFSYFGKDNYAVVDLHNANEDQLVAMLATLLQLDIKLQDENIESLSASDYRLYLTNGDILNALIDHPDRLADLKSFYEQILQVTKEPANSDSSQLSTTERSDSSAELESAVPIKPSPHR